MSTLPRANVAVLSIGEMGLGVANLLLAHGYRVFTNLEGRRLVLFQLGIQCLVL